jgi:hypothetical protein
LSILIAGKAQYKTPVPRGNGRLRCYESPGKKYDFLPGFPNNLSIIRLKVKRGSQAPLINNISFRTGADEEKYAENHDQNGDRA